MKARSPKYLARGALVACAAAAFACALRPPEEPPEPAQLTIEVYSGFSRSPAAASEPVRPKHIDVVVDLSESMTERRASGETRAGLARRSAGEFLGALAAGTEVTLRALGHVPGAACTGAPRLGEPGPPDAIARRLRSLEPPAEGSLAETLGAIAGEFGDSDAAPRTRVVVFTDLEDPCGGDLCAAAEALVSAGAWLELVPLGEAAAPACLADLRPSSAHPGATASGLTPRPPAFRVEAARREPAPDLPLATGVAGQGPVSVEPGLVTVIVALDPPEEIGPFRVAAGSHTRVRLLNFFDFEKPRRVWRVERAAEVVGQAFPPPEAPERWTGGGAGPALQSAPEAGEGE